MYSTTGGVLGYKLIDTAQCQHWESDHKWLGVRENWKDIITVTSKLNKAKYSHDYKSTEYQYK